MFMWSLGPLLCFEVHNLYLGIWSLRVIPLVLVILPVPPSCVGVVDETPLLEVLLVGAALGCPRIEEKAASESTPLPQGLNGP